MVARGSGNIINIASVHTVATLPAAAPYAASKGGVDMMTRSMAIEFAPFGIRVNAVSPGLTDTQIWNDIQDAAEDADMARQTLDGQYTARSRAVSARSRECRALLGKRAVVLRDRRQHLQRRRHDGATGQPRKVCQQVIGGQGAARP